MNLEVKRINMNKHPLLIKGEKELLVFKFILEKFNEFYSNNQNHEPIKLPGDIFETIKNIIELINQIKPEREDIIVLNDKKTVLDLIYVSYYGLVDDWYTINRKMGTTEISIYKSVLWRVLEFAQYYFDSDEELKKIKLIHSYLVSHGIKRTSSKSIKPENLKYPDDYC